MRAALSAQRNKTDGADALGLAHLMRTGSFRQAHVKTDGSYRLRLFLIQRRNLKRKFLGLENTIRHSLCHKNAVLAVARKLAVIMHAIWRDGSEYADRPTDERTSGAPSVKDRRLLRAFAYWP